MTEEMSEELSETDIFVLLSQRRRRLALQILREANTPLTVVGLATRIGDRGYDEPSEKDLRAIYLSLYHNHLPRFGEADVVEYNKEMGTVRPGLNFDTLVRVLENVDEMDLPWSDE